FTSLPGPAEVEAVALGSQGILAGIRPGAVYVDLSTSRPTLIRHIEPQFRAKGAHVLDAPVSGGKTGAATRNLAVMVGGEREIFERLKPILDAFGDKVFYAGAIGAGSICNLAHKDIALANELGREFNVPMPVASLAEQIAIEALNRGWGDQDSSVTFLLQEEAADVEVRAPHVDYVQAGKFISTHPETE